MVLAEHRCINFLFNTIAAAFERQEAYERRQLRVASCVTLSLAILSVSMICLLDEVVSFLIILLKDIHTRSVCPRTCVRNQHMVRVHSSLESVGVVQC